MYIKDIGYKAMSTIRKFYCLLISISFFLQAHPKKCHVARMAAYASLGAFVNAQSKWFFYFSYLDEK